MSAIPRQATWFPDDKVNHNNIAPLSNLLLQTAKQAGFTRETYAIAVAQMAEALVGFDIENDIDAEVLRFVADRLRATADAIDASSN